MRQILAMSVVLSCILAACGPADPPAPLPGPGGTTPAPGPVPEPTADGPLPPPDAAPPADLGYPIGGGGPLPGQGVCSVNRYQPYLCPDGACGLDRDFCGGLIMRCGERWYHCYEGWPVNCCGEEFALCPPAQPYLCARDRRCARTPALCPHREDNCDYQGAECLWQP